MKPLVFFLLWTLVAAAANGDPMSFEQVSNGGNCTNCQWTVSQGEITRDTPDALRSFLAEYAHPGRLMFDSPGGNLGAALELGRIIREIDLAAAVGRSVEQGHTAFSWYETEPGGTCESACAFAFLGEAARTANEDDTVFAPAYGQIGMHQFFTLDGQNIPSSDTQQIMGQVLLYMLDMGINAELLTVAARTPPDQMCFFSRKELLDLGVLTFEGSEPLGLFVDRGGLAIGWRAKHASGDVDRTITLRCSAAAQGWVLRVRDHGIADFSVGFLEDSPDSLVVLVEEQRFQLNPTDLLSLATDSDDHVLEVRLPKSLPVFAGQDFKFHTNPSFTNDMVLGADETLPDAETFSVLARACGV